MNCAYFNITNPTPIVFDPSDLYALNIVIQPRGLRVVPLNADEGDAAFSGLEVVSFNPTEGFDNINGLDLLDLLTPLLVQYFHSEIRLYGLPCGIGSDLDMDRIDLVLSNGRWFRKVGPETFIRDALRDFKSLSVYGEHSPVIQDDKSEYVHYSVLSSSEFLVNDPYLLSTEMRRFGMDVIILGQRRGDHPLPVGVETPHRVVLHHLPYGPRSHNDDHEHILQTLNSVLEDTACGTTRFLCTRVDEYGRLYWVTVAHTHSGWVRLDYPVVPDDADGSDMVWHLEYRNPADLA